MAERILIVEDERAVRSSIRYFLEDLGYSTIETESASEAWQAFDRETVDLIVLDLRLPGRPGIDLLRDVRQRSGDVPVVIVSGTGKMSDAVDALRLGAWDYLFKPLEDMGVLEHSVKKALEHVRLAGQNEAYRMRLEEMVATRTAELETVNSALQRKTIALEEVLATCRTDCDRRIARTVERIEQFCAPLLAELRRVMPASHQKLLDGINAAIEEASSEQVDRLSQALSVLSPAELRVCEMIREGRASKEIAASIGVTVDTVETHRRNIRRKLKITNESVNLSTYLNQLIGQVAPPSRDLAPAMS
jgi:FixJ family two-component response regulator